MSEKLAIEGGSPAKTTPTTPMYPGGLEIGEEERRQVNEVLDRKYLFRYYGPEKYPSKVRELELAFAEKFGARYALATSSCTGALISALTACRIRPGDQVLVPGYTFFASCAAIVAANGIPVIVDCDESLTMDPEDMERKITPHTRAAVVVHMRGAPADMDGVLEVAGRHDLRVVEDAAQACGGSYRGRRLGTFGDLGAFSFQYHKIITAGEGGMALSDDETLYTLAQAAHDTAACWRPERFAEARFKGENFCGYNFRMSELHGAVMLAQLGRLDGLLERMRRNKRRIMGRIGDIEGITFRRLNDPDGDTAICLIFFVKDAETCQKFSAALAAENVAASSISNKGIPDWHIYRHWDHVFKKVSAAGDGFPWSYARQIGKDVEYSKDMCPKLNDLLGRAVHINIPPQMTDEDCDMIAKAVRKVAEAYL